MELHQFPSISFPQALRATHLQSPPIPFPSGLRATYLQTPPTCSLSGLRATHLQTPSKPSYRLIDSFSIISLMKKRKCKQLKWKNICFSF